MSSRASLLSQCYCERLNKQISPYIPSCTPLTPTQSSTSSFLLCNCLLYTGPSSLVCPVVIFNISLLEISGLCSHLYAPLPHYWNFPASVLCLTKTLPILQGPAPTAPEEPLLASCSVILLVTLHHCVV